jgi:hypothetical protein
VYSIIRPGFINLRTMKKNAGKDGWDLQDKENINDEKGIH